MAGTVVRLYISDDLLKGHIMHLAPDDPIQLAIEGYQPFIMTKDHKWFKTCSQYLCREGSLEVWELKTVPGRTVLEPVRERFYDIKFTNECICGAYLMEKQQRHQSMEEAAEAARESYQRLTQIHLHMEDIVTAEHIRSSQL